MPPDWQVTHLCAQGSAGSRAQAEGREGRRVRTAYPSRPAQGTVPLLREGKGTTHSQMCNPVTFGLTLSTNVPGYICSYLGIL